MGACRPSPSEAKSKNPPVPGNSEAYNGRAMRLLIKFNLILIVVFGSGVLLAGYRARNYLQETAHDQVLQQARLMLGSASAMRTYTSKQVGPLLEQHQKQINTFLPQTIPFFAATEAFNYLHADYPDYAYKEATLNPTNLRDRAADWESDVIQSFRTHPEEREFSGERDTPAGRALFLAKPITVATPCLECHGMWHDAPPALIRVYGKDNGFGWNAGDTIGAQIISVPMSVPLGIADRAFRTLVLSLGGISLATLLLLDLAIFFIVIRPVTKLSKAADQISKGDLSVPELPTKGSDEIAQLAQSFNRMYLSLVKAIRMLESQ
jgi:HAMP domain-containing protein